MAFPLSTSLSLPVFTASTDLEGKPAAEVFGAYSALYGETFMLSQTLGSVTRQLAQAQSELGAIKSEKQFLVQQLGKIDVQADEVKNMQRETVEMMLEFSELKRIHAGLFQEMDDMKLKMDAFEVKGSEHVTTEVADLNGTEFRIDGASLMLNLKAEVVSMNSKFDMLCSRVDEVLVVNAQLTLDNEQIKMTNDQIVLEYDQTKQDVAIIKSNPMILKLFEFVVAGAAAAVPVASSTV